VWDTLVLTSTYFRFFNQIEFYIYLIILKNDCKPLTARVEEARWRMFGHILRSAENTPAQTALSFALEGASMHKSRRGRHQINLFNVLKGDLDKRGLLFKDIDDLFNLRILAKDRLLWKEYYDKV